MIQDKKCPELEFKINTPAFLKEVFDQNPTLGGVLFVPINTLQGYLAQIAERASELNDPKLNAIMCQMALYAVADPYDKENYDRKVTEETIRKKYL